MRYFIYIAAYPILTGPFILEEERVNTRNTLLRVIPRLSPSYIVRFDFKPTYFQREYTNILHLSASGKDCCNQGDRMPAVFFHGSSLSETKNRVSICSAVNGRGNYCISSGIIVPRGQWTTIEISQGKDANTPYRYRYTVKVGDVVIASLINKQPRYYSNVQVFGSNPEFNAAQGTMKNLIIIPNAPGNIEVSLVPFSRNSLHIQA